MTIEKMTHWERIRATVKGEETDRAPICLWRHWPIKDQKAETLADVIVDWQEKYDCDLVKHAPAGSYVVEDWGGETTYIPENDRKLGVRTFTKLGVTESNQWEKLGQLDVTKNHLGQQIDAVKMVADRLNKSVPILQTVFSPLNIAPKLGGDLAFNDMRNNPELFEKGLKIIAETTKRFALACLEAGADGLLFVAQSNFDMYTEEEYRRFGEPYDRVILEGARSDAEIIILLSQGQNIMFDRIAKYPVDGLNWHDRFWGPSLKDAYERFPGMLMGGIDEKQTLRNGTKKDITSEIHDAIEQTGGRRLLVGPGGAPLIATPPGQFSIARRAVEL